MASPTIMQATARRARNSLSRELILTAAHGLVQSGEEISLRGVAAILECSPMALYRHFPDKQDLLLGLLDRVIGSIDLGDDTQFWDEKLVSLAKNHLRTLQNNQWAIPLLFKNPDPGPAVRKVGETILANLKQGGASNEMAVSIFSSILAVNYGWAGFTSGKMGPVPLRLGKTPSSQDGLPETSEIWPEFETLGSNEHHEAAIRKLISL